LCYTLALVIFDEQYLIMAAITFDTLKYANKLKAAGAESRIAEAEAEALAEVFELNLKEVATRDDLKQMEERLNERLDARLLQLEQRMIIKLGGLMVVAIGTVATLVKLL
jgi:Tfp pilus assembly protein PilO